ncbi:CLUMA_CG020375, isoform A [Clunio marinus]|uniref:Probable U2 small nuclear ribonucleoprotein A' n=1 Tax=Clunio marinus TaxID=568069 RepID=A0A1J1J5Y1_9DIPT|nr:CLUMA_CG020375, isoform A [Clunio marinus]
MVKLTTELINSCMQYINPCRDRELDLRGYKIPEIQNMGSTLDQFDTIDFSDNDLRKLGGFPHLQRIKCLLLNNNRIARIADDLHETIPNLESLILTGNNLQDLGDIDSLSKLPKLAVLSLLTNPIASKKHYREYVIFKLPHLHLLDFKKIKQKERMEAVAFFKSKKGKEIQKEIQKRSRLNLVTSAENDKPKVQNVNADIQKIREAISKATSLQEVERLTKMLTSGQISSEFFNEDEMMN